MGDFDVGDELHFDRQADQALVYVPMVEINAAPQVVL